MLRRGWDRGISVAIGALCCILLVTFAIVSDGYPIRKLDLNDAGVWVVNDSQHQIGRVNKSAAGLDAWLDAPGMSKQTMEVLQDGNAVVHYDPTQKLLIPVSSDDVKNINEETNQLPPGALVEMRGGTLAALDLATGKVSAVRYDPKAAKISVRDLDLEGGALVELGPAPQGSASPGALSVGADGTVHAALANGKRVTIGVSGEGFAEPQVDTVGALQSVQLAAIGNQAVAYDPATGTLVLPGGTTAQLEADPESFIQMGGPHAETALVATTKGLFRVRLDDGSVTQVAGGLSGVPAVPVRLAGCDFGAWTGEQGTMVRVCGDGQAEELKGIRSSGALTRPVFRVNREQIVLNDAADGRAFDLVTQNRLDAWDEIRPDQEGDQVNPEESSQPKPQDAEPQANPDTVGVRPGRTVIAHVLDNDTDALGQVLMVQSVSGVPSGAQVVIAPDGQTLAVTPSEGSGDFSFTYTVSNGVKLSEASVSVTIRASGNQQPRLRPGYTAPNYAVSSHGTLPLPVLGDWRDGDGDPVTLLSATVDGVSIPVTPEGGIEYTAGAEASRTVRKLVYRVTDGRSDPIEHQLPITVLEETSAVGTPPLTFPDAVRGEVGKPVVFNPLANDIPGSDPGTPDARLRLGGEIKPVPGLEIESDIYSGQVRVTAATAGSYEISYTAAFGVAPMQVGKVRIDVVNAEQSQAPIVMPDQLTVRGVQTVRLDPLPNDSDPAGGILTVVEAKAESSDLDVVVVSGRWVLVTPRAESIQANPSVVRYTVTNGAASASGIILVTQLPAAHSVAPIVKDDIGVVRAGDSVLLNVLNNDVAPNGEPLSLVTNAGKRGTPGELVVRDPSGSNDTGRAFVRHDQIRYVAPKEVETERQVVVEYSAQTQAGQQSAVGKAVITIKPEPKSAEENRAPSPQPIEARIRAGDTVKISISPTSQDPDGDSVVLVGLGSAPQLGRVGKQSPTSITYEAYPSPEKYGTDTFTVLLADRFGKASAAVVRIGVTPPSSAQAPIAMPDEVIAAPGSTVQVDPLANDLYERSDTVTLDSLEALNPNLPPGVSLDSEAGPVTIQAPARDAQPLVLQYAIRGSGGKSQPAAIKVSSREGYKHPPAIWDEVAIAEGDVAKADLLKRAWDPDGDDSKLRVTLLGGPNEATMADGVATIPLTGQVQIIPYLVTDESGAASAAVIFVPSAGTAAPHTKAKSIIEIGQGQSVELNLSDYVVSPRGLPVRFTPRTESFSASPAGKLKVEPVSETTFRVSALGDYVGPGAVTFDVMDGERLNDEGVRSAYVSVPVQIGPATPILRCGNQTIELTANGSGKEFDVAKLCYLWMPPGEEPLDLSYEAAWESGGGLNGVQVQGGNKLQLRAGGAAEPGATGKLMIKIQGYNTPAQPVTVVVREAPPPTMRSHSLNDIKAGTPVSIPLGIDSPLLDARPQVVSVTKTSGPEATVAVNKTTLTITPDAGAHGDLVYQVVATDVADHGRTDRHVSATIRLQVYGLPETPGAPVIQSVSSGTATITWGEPGNNGSPITEWEVTDDRGRVASACSSGPPCQISGLTNGQEVRFKVRARNKAGWSESSPLSGPAVPDVKPPALSGLRVSNPRDRKITLSWNPVVFEGSALQEILILVDGKVQKAAGPGVLSHVVTMPDNNKEYQIQVWARNAAGAGPRASITGQSAGKPLGLQPPVLRPKVDTGDAAVVIVTWNEPDRNGPPDLSYTLTRDGQRVCGPTSGTQCTDDRVSFDGRRHTYMVVATNGAGGAEHSASSSKIWDATGLPEQPPKPDVSPTGNDREARVIGRVGAARGNQARLRILADDEEVFSGPINPRGGAFDKRVMLKGNNISTQIKTQLCNEHNCGPESPADTVSAYGPIKDLTIKDAGSDGQKVSYAVSVDPNGRPVVVRVNGKEFLTGPSGPWTTIQTVDLEEWDEEVVFVATASDGSRRAGPVSVILKSDPAPPPKKVKVTRGRLQQGPTCRSAWCALIMVETSGFPGPVRCRISDSDLFGDFGRPWTQGGNERASAAGQIYGGDSITVTCNGVSGTNDDWRP